MLREGLEKPLPKPRRDLLGYASARALEALLEGLLALEFLGKGYTRNAAGKAFQAWRALTATLLALERDRIVEAGGGEGKWLLERGIPTARLKAFGQLLEKTGIPYYSSLTDKALDLHDYQYHGPEPDVELSKYRDRREAAYDILALVAELAKMVAGRVRPRLEKSGKWSRGPEEALQKLLERLA